MLASQSGATLPWCRNEARTYLGITVLDERASIDVLSRSSMRLFEIILILAIVAAAILQISKIAAHWSLSLTLLGVLLAAWHVVRGTYWQMFPALAGLLASSGLADETKPCSSCV